MNKPAITANMPRAGSRITGRMSGLIGKKLTPISSASSANKATQVSNTFAM
jgi:hypothetical protein